MINDSILDAIVAGTHADPFSVLGVHAGKSGEQWLTAWLPTASKVVAEVGGDSGVSNGSGDSDNTNGELALTKVRDAGLFRGLMPVGSTSDDYRLRVSWPLAEVRIDDPYRHGSTLSESDLWLYSEGSHQRPYEFLGAHLVQSRGVDGVRFAVWAPNASQVSLIGDFNAWDSTRYPMRRHPGAGVWEIFIPGIGPGERYQFAIRDAFGESLPGHADPYARQAQIRPERASVISALPLSRAFGKAASKPAVSNHRAAPISVYEVHLPSWRRITEQDNRCMNWDELAAELVTYVSDMGFTHVELLPISEYPLDDSWGYQPTGLYAPSARFGEPAGLRRFVDACHDAGIGVVLDWVPGHFPEDAHALAKFDGTALFEHADPREGLHQDWGSLIYNFGRLEVREFLLGNARYWVEQFDVDALRVDAVASMIYRDYSRKPGQWVPNKDGGRENYEAISLLQEMNTSLGASHPQVATIAEESTAFSGVSAPVSANGLGFHYKWNMGWMNDTLRFMARDPAHRGFHLNEMTFGMVYAYSENFVLPLSHDEVVHGKGSLLARMPGDQWQKMANLRLYLGFMFAHPGKKLLFMGGEFAQPGEWQFNASLDWHLLEHAEHRGCQALVRDLNHLYRSTGALHELDCQPEGFEWVVADDTTQVVLAFLRYGAETGQTSARSTKDALLSVSNFTPVIRENYRLGVPRAGQWVERFNSDAAIYGGSNVGNLGGVMAQPVPMHGHPYSIAVTLPPLSTLMFYPAITA